MLIASVILLALILLGLGLKSLLRGDKSNNITSCGLSSSEKQGCVCSNTDNCKKK
jgi:hypothetical protein